MSHRIDFVWHAPEVYKVKFDGETVCTLYKTDEGYWELLSEAKISIRRALKSYSR